MALINVDRNHMSKVSKMCKQITEYIKSNTFFAEEEMTDQSNIQDNLYK